MESNTLPVSRIVLYKHGIGYIERKGKTGNQTRIKLSFKKDLMNDILKSLVVISEGEGLITGISYETPEDISKLIAERAIRVPSKEALVGLFRQLNGYNVEIITNTDTVKGKVVGTQEATYDQKKGIIIDVGNREAQKPMVVIKTDKDEIINVQTDKIKSYRILDKEALEDLDFFLEGVTSERKKDMKSVWVVLDGKESELLISYIMQMPTWRVSYRLLYDKENTMLQGWGIIDNQLDEDLKDINISLIAGKPISFEYDLYNPPKIERKVIKEEFKGVSAPVELEERKVREQEFDQDMVEMQGLMEQKAQRDRLRVAEMEKRKERPSFEMQHISAGRPPAMEMEISACRSAISVGDDEIEEWKNQKRIEGESVSRSTSVSTKSKELGEFFKYDITRPVSIMRGQSAMVPIIQDGIECLKEHVYNSQKMQVHPLVTMKLKNNTDLILERGPIVVIDDSTYVGEAILPYMSSSGECNLVYSVDTNVKITEEMERKSKLLDATVRGEEVIIKNFASIISEYHVSNKNKQPIDLVIDHPKRNSYELVDMDDPAEETENFYRWKIPVEGGKNKKFRIVEGKEEGRVANLNNMRLATEEFLFVSLEHDLKTNMVDVQLNGDKLEIKNTLSFITEYSLYNKCDHKIPITIEHKKDENQELVDMVKPDVETENFYGWKLEIDCSKDNKFKITEGMEEIISKNIQEINLEELEEIFNQKLINNKTMEFIKTVIEKSKEIKSLMGKIDKIEGSKRGIIEEQDRILEKLKALEDKGEEERLRKQYAVKLEALEMDLESNAQSIKGIRKKINEIEKEIREMIKKETKRKKKDPNKK